MPISKKLLEEIENNTFNESLLALEGENIKYPQIKKLVKALKKNTTIKHISLSENPIGDKSAKLLATLDNVETLNVDFTNIKNIGLRALIRSKLKVIGFHGNKITWKGLKNIPSNSTLEELALTGCNLKKKSIELISKNKSLKSLFLDKNYFQNIGDGFKHLLKHPCLETLSLSDCHLNDENIKPFGQNKTIKKLFLSFNEIGIEGIKELSKNKEIRTLNLYSNKIDDECAKYLASMSSLKELNVQFNLITEKGEEILDNSLIEDVELIGNPCFLLGQKVTDELIEEPPFSTNLLTLSFDFERKRKETKEAELSTSFDAQKQKIYQSQPRNN